MASPRDEVSAGSILRELIFNQYQAIVAGGAVLASIFTLNPLPLLLWAGSELVLLPILDSPPLRRRMARKRREIARRQAAEHRARLIASFDPAFVKRYAGLEQPTRTIEANYQSLSGISQAYLGEQRSKLDHILDGSLNRMLALQRYEKMQIMRNPSDLKKEIAALEEELKQPTANERTRAALEKNLDLKRRLLASYSAVGGNMRALATELDSMASLLEVLYQNSISLRDPQAISEELDTIVRQSEDSERAVREMEALLRSGTSGLDSGLMPDYPMNVPGPGPVPSSASRQKVKGR